MRRGHSKDSIYLLCCCVENHEERYVCHRSVARVGMACCFNVEQRNRLVWSDIDGPEPQLIYYLADIQMQFVVLHSVDHLRGIDPHYKRG